jgi:hypothetical protein
MWRFLIQTPKEASLHFGDFLEINDADEHPTDPLDGIPSCVLDLVELWVVRGNALEICPTYESFLLTVIEIIAEWHHNPDDVRWLLEDGEELSFDKLATPGDTADSAGWGSFTPTDHPVLRKANFVLQQAARVRYANYK